MAHKTYWYQKVWPWLGPLLVVFVVGGHVALWLSDTPRDVALRLTLINAAGWAVILLPAYGVSQWLKAREGGPTTKGRD